MTTLLTLAFSTFAAAAPLGTVTLDNGVVTLDRGQGPERVEVSCTATSAVIDTQLHVACSDGRVLTYSLDGAPTLVRVARTDGELRGLFLRGDEAWVEVAKVEARPLKQAAIAALPVSAPPLPQAAQSAPSKPLEPGDTLLGPSRQAGVFAEAGVRLAIPIGLLAVGATFELGATWHAEAPFAVRARLSPLAGVTATNNTFTFPPTGGGPAGVSGGSLEAMFDGRYFAVGLGVGWGLNVEYPFNGTGQPAISVNPGFTILQTLRVGALDGLSLSAQTQVILSSSGFTFYGGEGTVQIPIQRKWLLQLRGGAVAAGFVFGEVAMRIGLGTEERARFFLVPALGVTSIRTATGPSVGLGAEYRF